MRMVEISEDCERRTWEFSRRHAVGPSYSRIQIFHSNRVRSGYCIRSSLYLHDGKTRERVFDCCFLFFSVRFFRMFLFFFAFAFSYLKQNILLRQYAWLNSLPNSQILSSVLPSKDKQLQQRRKNDWGKCLALSYSCHGQVTHVQLSWWPMKTRTSPRCFWVINRAMIVNNVRRPFEFSLSSQFE